MAEKNRFELVINFDEYHRKYDERKLSLFTRYTIISTKGFYLKNENVLQDALDKTNRGRILEVLFYKKKTNALELAKIIDIPYSLIKQYVTKLKALRLIKLKEGISDKGRQEVAITLHPDVKLIPYSEFVDSKDFKEIAEDEKEFAKEAEEEYKKMLEEETK
jgi:hypothetical protein